VDYERVIEAEKLLVELLEEIEGYKCAPVNTAIAILQEVVRNCDRQTGKMPPFTRAYLKEKTELLLNSVE